MRWKQDPRLKSNAGKLSGIHAYEIIAGYPCKYCGSWSIERKIDCTYYWVDFGIVLVKNVTNYVYKTCRHVLIQIVEHTEGKHD